MDWKKATKDDAGNVKIPARWLHLYYYEALNILFRFENALRVFVYVILKKELGGEWDKAAVGTSTIRSETKKRITQSKDHGYLGYEVNSPMLYLNSGELIDIISSEAYWKHFAPYFKATKSIVQTKLQEIGTVRNSLAHFRPIKEDDIDLIKQNSKHVLLEIENCLLQLTAIADPVPTNSEENWYKNIKPIGGSYSSMHLYISPDQNWVRLELRYDVPTIEFTVYGSDYIAFKVGNLRTSEILKQYPTIKDNCIYLCENHMYGTLGENNSVSAPKWISIVFSKKVLESNLDQITGHLKEITLKIDAETELIKSDHGARGQFIEPISSNGVRQVNGESSYWNFNVENMGTALTEIDDAEFWGQRSNYRTDFVCATERYPWMPSSVSDFDWSV